MTKRLVPILCVLTLTGGITFYLNQRNTTPPEPIKIYKTVKPNPPKDIPVLMTQPGRTPVNATSDGALSALSEGISLNKKDYNVDANSPNPQDETDTNPPNPQDETMDVVDEEASMTEKKLDRPKDPEAWITERMEIINASIEEKYPDIYALGSMTQEEVYKKYPTAESRAQLASLAQEVQSEYFGELRQLFLRLPSDSRAEFLMTLEIQLSQNWGVDAAREMVEIVRRDLDP